jgi:hypothetical protein
MQPLPWVSSCRILAGCSSCPPALLKAMAAATAASGRAEDAQEFQRVEAVMTALEKEGTLLLVERSGSVRDVDHEMKRESSDRWLVSVAS